MKDAVADEFPEDRRRRDNIGTGDEKRFEKLLHAPGLAVLRQVGLDFRQQRLGDAPDPPALETEPAGRTHRLGC